MIHQLIKILCCTFLITFLFSFQVFAQERNTTEKINNFVSNIIVNTDASIDVTENISVYVAQDKIKHGITRRLPTRYTDSYGLTRHTQYHIKTILLNGNTSTYHIQNRNNQMTIYIGSKDLILPKGDYTYTIQYRVDDAINFLSDADELYWNITGNNWDFDIDKAEANITIPQPAKIITYVGYTGVTGDKGTNFKVNQVASNHILFSTINTLRSGEGLTVAVSFQKGIVIPPTWWDKFKQQIKTIDYMIIIPTIVVFLYYFVIWYLYGRGPKPGTIVPLFEPPEELPPEAMRYIMRMGYDAKTFSAAIIALATKGYVTIDNESDSFILTKTASTVPLSLDQNAFLQTLFSSGTTLDITQTNKEVIQKARDQLKKNLKSAYLNKYFITNIGYQFFGWLMSLLVFISAIKLADDPSQAFGALTWISVWTFACAILLKSAFENIEIAWVTRTFKSIGKALGSSLFALPFLAGEVMGIYFLSQSIPIFTIPMLFLIAALNVIFFYLLKAPTVSGREIMDKIEGFKLFFTTTERYRIEKMVPTDTPECYEKYLPYAIALDLENEWNTLFDNVLRQANIAPTAYQPSWYRGSPLTRSSATLPVLLGAGLASSIASASTFSSSSASGGGGSSGGGGGGGGGGGW